jgi:hypothetical protein
MIQVTMTVSFRNNDYLQTTYSCGVLLINLMILTALAMTDQQFDH